MIEKQNMIPPPAANLMVNGHFQKRLRRRRRRSVLIQWTTSSIKGLRPPHHRRNSEDQRRLPAPHIQLGQPFFWPRAPQEDKKKEMRTHRHKVVVVRKVKQFNECVNNILTEFQRGFSFVVLIADSIVGGDDDETMKKLCCRWIDYFCISAIEDEEE